MDIEEEIVKALSRATDEGANRTADYADALMPLVKRAQAEAAARTLRALSEKYDEFGKREVDSMVKVTYKTAAAFMAAEAEHIENEGAGA